jgi:pSer/pThr/pTyr-binding forkhead associated (FHA) protein
MVAKVTLTIQGGSLDGSEFTFEEPAHCVVGRGEDCDVRLPNKGWEFKMVSRHHCQLDIGGPRVRVRDLGSRNGTYVNGRLIGLRTEMEPSATVSENMFASHDLKNGDVLSVGPIAFWVRVASVEKAEATAVSKTPADWMMMAI